MNTENTPIEAVKRGRGRPRNINSAIHYHYININPDTKIALGKGRVKDGTRVLRVKINKEIKCSQFVWGATQVLESQELVIGNPQIPAAANINVTVIEPPNEAVESAPAQAAVEIPV